MQHFSEAIGFLALKLIQLTHSFNAIPLRHPNVQTISPNSERYIEENSPTQNLVRSGEEQHTLRELKSLA